MTTPLVSIITPAFNAAKNLRRAIDCVRAQSFQDWEMIIIDDASEDGTTAMASYYAGDDDRIRIIRRSEANGLVAARNQGMQAATGRFIAFLNPDDVWLSNKLEQQLNFMDERAATICATAYRRFDSLEKPFRLQRAASLLTFDRLLGKNPVTLSSVIIDTTKLGPFHFDTQLPAGEDHALWLCLTKSGNDIYFLDEDLLRVDIHAPSANPFFKIYGQWHVYRNEALPTRRLVTSLLRHAFSAGLKRLF